MSNFVNHPLQKLSNRENIFSRVENLEDGQGAQPSAKVVQLGQLTQSTGNLVIDGEVLIINRATGEVIISLGADGVRMQNSANAWWNFEDASGNFGTINIAATPSNALEIVNFATSPAGIISFFVKDSIGTQRRIMHTDEFMRVVVGDDHIFATRWSSNTTTYLNEANQDMDVIIEGATAAINLISDAGLDAVGIGGAAESGYKLKVHGSVNILTGETYDINGSAHQHNSTDVIAAYLNSVTVPASTTYNAAPLKLGADGTGNNVPWPEAGTLSNLSFRTSSAQPASGTMVVTLHINNVASSITTTIAAGAAAGTFVDNTHTESIAAGDLLKWVIVNNATAASATLTAVSMRLTKQTT